MTTPEQSRRAVETVGQFIRYLAFDEQYLGIAHQFSRMPEYRVPRCLIDEAEALLRHYPTTDLAIRTINDDRPDKPCLDELVEALRSLYDAQNGPPLLRDEKTWREAMEEVRLVLAKYEPKE